MPARPAISTSVSSTSAIASKQGELLAELAVPEQDDQISQNEATRNQLQSALDQAQANLKLAQVTWDRDQPPGQ